MATDVEGVDVFTQRPRTPNDQYTHLSEEQIRNIKKDPSPFFQCQNAERSAPVKLPREGGRHYRDRFTAVTNEHLVRGQSGTQPFGWVDYKWSRHPPEEYDSCRGRAAVRWGKNKAGEKTRSHFFGESHDRYTTIDMYRRNPTNYPGRVVMDCGRPADGYYAQKYPSRTTWFGSTAPLNRANVMMDVYPKTSAEYAEIRQAEVMSRETRKNQWPEFSEYTEKYLLQTKTAPSLTGLAEKKRLLEESRKEAMRN